MCKPIQPCLASLATIGMAAVLLWLPPPAIALEPPCTAECKAACKAACKDSCQLQVDVRGILPMLERLLHVEYLPPPASEGQVVATPTEGIERLGVDFDFLPNHRVSFLPIDPCNTTCSENACTASAGCGATCQAKAATSSAAAGTGDPCPGDTCRACDLACKQDACGTVTAEARRMVRPGLLGVNLHEICDQLIELQAENSALRAALDAQDALAATFKARSEMMQSILQLSMDKARLEARVEWLAERDEMQGKLLSLVAENARLQAVGQLVEERQNLLKQQVELLVENERLQSRVAELERSQDSMSETARTAQKPRSTKKNLSTR